MPPTKKPSTHSASATISTIHRTWAAVCSDPLVVNSRIGEHHPFQLTLRNIIAKQALVRYTWDGETAVGMVERSMPADKLTG